jgi:hypothetical protein
MPLTLSQVLFIILTVAAVVAVIFLVQLFAQLRKTAAEAEKALVEVRALAKNLSELDFAVKARVDEFGDTLRASKKAALSVSEASFLVTSKFLQPSSKLLPLLLPVARFVLRQVKKRKEKKNVQ